MNDEMKAGEQCWRLIGGFELAPEDCPQTADGAALEAYLCSANKPTLAFGCTRHPDGTPVKLGDKISEDQIPAYMDAAVGGAEADANRLLTRKMSQYEFDAVVSFIYNEGATTLAESSNLLSFINAGRNEDAASEFSVFLYTRKAVWKDGRPWKRALRGLLRRRFAEGCVYLGYDWSDACQLNHVSLIANHNLSGPRVNDEVQPGTTQFSAIFRQAQNHPLPDPDETPETVGAEPDLATRPGPAPSTVTIITDKPAPPKAPPTNEPDPSPTPPVGETPHVNATPPSDPLQRVEPKSAPPSPPFLQDAPAKPYVAEVSIVPVKPLSPNSAPVPPGVTSKPIEESKTVDGHVIEKHGEFWLRVASLGFLGTIPQDVAKAIMRDPALMAMVLATLAFIGMGAIAYATREIGRWKKARGREQQIQVYR